jgi:small subunit ribosomal protein S4
MGQPKKLRKTYSVPRKRWDLTRIGDESKVVERYGLKTKTEIYRAQEQVRTFRKTARTIFSLEPSIASKRTEELMNKVSHLGLLSKEATLDDVLGLKEVDIMNRRLQTIVFHKGLAKTVKQARQMIVHGKILVDGKRATSPSTLIPKDLEIKIESTMKLPETAPAKTVAVAPAGVKA